MNENLITRRDFGKLALVGAGSLLLTSPSTAFAATASTRAEAIDAASAAGRAKIASSLLSASNAVVESVKSPLYVADGYVRYGQTMTSNTVTVDDAFRVRYPGAAFYASEWCDVLIDCQRLFIESYDSARLAYDDFSVFGLHGSWTIFAWTGTPAVGAKMRTRIRIVRSGTEQVVPCRVVQLITDLDQRDRVTYDDPYEANGRAFYGPYSEGVALLSGYERDVYTSGNGWVRYDDGRWHGTVSDDGSWENSSMLCVVAAGDGVIEWAASKGSTGMGLSIDGSIGALTLKKAAQSPGVVVR